MPRAALAKCIELEDELSLRNTAHSRETSTYQAEEASVSAESKALASSQSAVRSADPAARDAQHRRLDTFNQRVAGLNQERERLNAETRALLDLTNTFNSACADRPFQARDKELARREILERRAAAAAATPFAEGLKAFDEQRYKDAFALWMPLAEQGRASPQFNVASMYEQGLGVDRNLVEAARWYLRAAQSGDAAAELKMGNLYETGLGVSKDLGSASYWYGEAAKAGGTDASMELARQAKVGLSRLPKEYQVGAEQIVPFDGGRYVVVRGSSKECVVALQGQVTRSALYNFRDAVRLAESQGCAKPLVLLLESPGGDFEAGLELGHSVRDEGMRTVVRYECASSCAVIFLAGMERVLWGVRAAIGLHQISEVRSDRSFDERRCVGERYDRLVRMQKGYLTSMVPESAEELMRIIIGTSCKSIEWVQGERALQLNVATKLEAEGQDVFGDKRDRMEPSSTAGQR